MHSRRIISVRPFRPFMARPPATWHGTVLYMMYANCYILLLRAVAVYFVAFTCRSHNASMKWRKYTTYCRVWPWNWQNTIIAYDAPTLISTVVFRQIFSNVLNLLNNIMLCLLRMFMKFSIIRNFRYYL